MNGHLVCLIGLTTKATLEDGNKSVVDNLSFIDYSAAVDYSIYTCKQEIKQQVFNSIESFVLLTHVESDQDEKTGEASGAAVTQIAQEVTEPKIDAVISGHSHKTVNASIHNGATGKDILVGQAETEGRKYLDLTFVFDNTKPVGQKKVRVEQEVVDMKMGEKYPEDTQAN
ncbi:MAG: hypothetical protein MJ195_03125 [Mycoplasmoidaceae bacterium]|nr:hypothetical protein [Mycoplasmoidaceae bacterium]